MRRNPFCSLWFSRLHALFLWREFVKILIKYETSALALENQLFTGVPCFITLLAFFGSCRLSLSSLHPFLSGPMTRYIRFSISTISFVQASSCSWSLSWIRSCSLAFFFRMCPKRGQKEILQKQEGQVKNPVTWVSFWAKHSRNHLSKTLLSMTWWHGNTWTSRTFPVSWIPFNACCN